MLPPDMKLRLLMFPTNMTLRFFLFCLLSIIAAGAPSPGPRMVMVDDIDSRIQYNGPWFPDKGSQDTLGVFGTPFRSTLHGSHASASLEFAYHGTEVVVYGTKPTIHNISGVPDLSWKCFVDGTPIDVIIPNASLNNGVFCEQDTLSDGPHILTVNATVMGNQTFWFDDIRYVPSASVPLDQETIIVSVGDPQLQYGQGWQDGATNTTGSIFTFDFIGVSITWYGDVYPGDQSSATYSIDGQTPIDFDFSLGNATKAWNQKLFETAQLSPGPHTLKVVYQGNADTTPLHLGNLVIQNGTLPSTATSASSHATSTNTSTGIGVSGPSTPGKGSTPVGAIVGGAIGGLTLIVFAILGLFLLRRHKRRTAEDNVLSSTPRPFNFGYTTLQSSTSPVQQSTLAIRKPLLARLPVSRPSGSPLLSRAEGNAEAPAASESQRRGDTLPAMVSKRGNATRPPDVVVHEDSGIRTSRGTAATNEIMEAPPLYTVD